ncbi:MAG: hypothetical protein LQ351_007391 [Letrouitia transgressa]|nr:MAG: hypothetical protein LQ351_007391 [Letrouitia transgressa]
MHKAVSISLSGARPTSASVALSSNSVNSKKRPHSFLNDQDSDDEHTPGEAVLISSFDPAAGGAVSVNGVETPKVPLVIHAQKNRDWREESRRKRGKYSLPTEVGATKSRLGQNGNGEVERNEVSQQSGLSFAAQKNSQDQNDLSTPEPRKKQYQEITVEEKVPRSVDEEALIALVGGDSKKSTLVLPVAQAVEQDDLRNGRLRALQINEDDHFRSDVASRPDPAGLEEYAKVPVEEFGAAILKGMVSSVIVKLGKHSELIEAQGWKEGEVVGKRKNAVSKARVVEKRPALLGLGAKKVPGGVADELETWGKVKKGKKGRETQKTYNPVLLRNAKTGEMLTEEELEAKKQAEREQEQERQEKRHRVVPIDEEKKGGRRQRELDHSYDRHGHSLTIPHRNRSSDRRHASSKRDTSRSRDRRHDDRRRDYDDYDRRERRERDHRRRETYGREEYRSSKHGHRFRDDYDDPRERRQAVY